MNVVSSRNVGRQNPFKYKTVKAVGYRERPVYPEDGQYTTRPLRVIKMGGRDPVTGRVVAACIGGGCKHKWRWVQDVRAPAEDGSPLVERVISIKYDPIRSGKIALVAQGDQKRWITASSEMKKGDLIKTSAEIPRNPVRPQEGDAWPLAALPLGTAVHNVEMFPGHGGHFARAAGSYCTVLRRSEGNVIVQLPSKREASLKETCMAVVGRVSNVDHNKIKLGTPQMNRYLGNRPRSGLWHRKDGYCGRKIRPMKPVRVYDTPAKPEPPVYKLTHV